MRRFVDSSIPGGLPLEAPDGGGHHGAGGGEAERVQVAVPGGRPRVQGLLHGGAEAGGQHQGY